MNKIYILFLVIAFSCNKKEEQISTENKTNEVVAKDTIQKSKATVIAKDFSEEENNLINLNNQINTALGNTRNDSLVHVLSAKFSESLINLIQKNNETLHYPFTNLQKENAIHLATSTDQKLRIYSWDNQEGGTMRFFNQLFQYNNQNQINTDVYYATNDAQAFFSKIFTVQKNDGTNIYLAIANSILSSKYSMQQVIAYEIKNNQLQEVAIFKTKSKLLSNISLEFDFFSVVDKPERPVELIKLNNKQLSIALVDKNSQVTTKNLVYDWDGTIFTYKGIQ